MKKKELAFIFVALAAGNAYAKEDAVLVQMDDLQITEQMLLDDIDANPDLKKEYLLGNAKQLNDYIDVFYREKVFEQLALKKKMDKNPKYQAMLKAAQRRMLSNMVVEDKKTSIAAPDMTQSAQEFYQVHQDNFKIGEQVEARHILLNSKPDNPDKEAVRQRLADILAEIKQDPSQFEALAKKYSDDPGSASKGGYLGKFTKGRMVSEFEREAFNLSTEGQLSDVFSTKFGFHIIQLIKKYPAQITPFEQVKDLIIKKLASDYVEAEYMRWRNEVVNPEKAQINKDKLQAFIKKIAK